MQTKSRLVRRLPLQLALVLSMLAGSFLPPSSAIAQNEPPDEIVWRLVKDSADAGTLTNFVAQFPDSPHVYEAEDKIAALTDEGGAFDAPAPEALPEPGKRFALYPGLDYYGNDIRPFSHTADAASCAQSCLANGQCVAFTFNTQTQRGPNCFLKSRIGLINAYSTAFSGLLLQPGADAPTYSFGSIDPTLGLDKGYGYSGAALSMVDTDLDGCIVACNKESSCDAFTFSGGQCELKQSRGGYYSASRQTSGTKRDYNIAASRIITLDE
jgi:hypothetical protein